MERNVSYNDGVPPGKTVLVVEDDAALRELYRTALVSAGYSVIAVEDGIDALRRVEREAPQAMRRASEQTGCTILGKAEFLNPGGSVKDRAAKYILLDAEARKEIEPGRRGGRGHRRQHRDRSRAGRQRARLPHGDLHPRHAEPGEEGHAAAVRRRAARGAGRAVQESRQLRPPGRALRQGAGEDRAARRALREPVGQPVEPRRPRALDRPRDLGADRTAASTASPARSAPAARCPASGSS